MGLSHWSSAPPSSSLSMHAFILLLCCGFLVVGGNNVTDRLALLEFKAKITQDPFGVMTSWNDSIHFCQWQGVTCGRRHQRVTVLDLQSSKLVGSITPHVGNLSFLINLTLPNNSFHSEIPPEIGRLRRLQVLRLDNNTLNGKIPSNLSGCANLIDFRVGYNLLMGEIPTTLGTWSKLRYFALYKNNITGTIPSYFGNLSSLEKFSLVDNNLGGNIPESFGQLSKLAFFSVAQNTLSGTIPLSIFNLSSLNHFSVEFNKIEGRLPLDIGITLPNIEVLGISRNQFTGSIPISISNATNLEYIGFNENKISGKVPSLEKLNRLRIFLIAINNLGNEGANDLSFICSLTNATNIDKLDIGLNNFGGEFPKCIGNFSTTLKVLNLESNKIFGSIHSEIGNLINLEDLEIFHNKLSGNIPYEIGKLQKIQYLDLSQNNFFGNIPSSLGNLTIVIYLRLFENNLQGSIPLSLKNCRNLLELYLNNNNLTGSISSQVIGLSFSPTFLDLSTNQFTGVLPMEIGTLKNLEFLDISKNMLIGKIPTSLGSCIKLEFLDMRKNLFQGIIPPSLGSLRGLQELDLSNNNLSGQIPEFLEHFVFLQFLNLSYNHFEGEVPKDGIFKNKSATFITGNDKLCGGIPKFQLPKCKHEKSKKKKLTHTLKLIISIFFGLLGATLVVSLLLLRSLTKKRKENTLSDSRNFLLNLSYQSLLNATDGFSSANLIGVGSFGSVYKGILDQGRHIVAIKVLNLLHHGASKSFIAECEVVRNVRHRNLVKVLTSCSGIDYQGNDFKALVYEFMANGNLDEWLHPTLNPNETLEEPRNLSLFQRLDIVIDVANALDYLHHHCQTPIVHCDLKPSNVLLDDEMIGHIGDFGLARLLFDATQECSIDHSSSIGVRGTIGYTPPEYGVGNEVSIYGDVYSYGILLLEMFTGKRPIDKIFQDGINLHYFVKEALSERIIDIVDPILLRERELGETRMNDLNHYEGQDGSLKIQECFALILGIGVACSVESPRERMNISDVIIKLHSIRQKLIGTNVRRQRLQATGARG
ncbi:probable LRR receptor-like serine/threonine-protein kinase At3g47570 [Quercus lobata]|uniref:non-specific serine/threonine protein kinase n=1 Tax=Quercus lobata TaxID=97700 RepID=A0A7N2LCS4_QUELO|nr:probable LRR receptor-like serine/threonine-protein kinase At3g47570 [Quercus lobata]